MEYNNYRGEIIKRQKSISQIIKDRNKQKQKKENEKRALLLKEPKEDKKKRNPWGSKRLSPKEIFIRARNSAGQRRVEFKLDIDKFAEYWNNTNKCHYCGITAKQYKTFIRRIAACRVSENKKLEAIRRRVKIFNKTDSIPTNFTIDRINSFIGYLPNNIVKCCWFCNATKGQLIHGKLYKKIAKKLMKWAWKIVKKQYEKEHEEKCNFVQL